MLRCLGVCDYHLQDPDSQRLEMGAEIQPEHSTTWLCRRVVTADSTVHSWTASTPQHTLVDKYYRMLLRRLERTNIASACCLGLGKLLVCENF